MTVDDKKLLAEVFEVDRAHLRRVAYRLLGSLADADDAVQDAWLRASRADTSEVTNLTGWFTTIVARVCLNKLQSRQVRSEQPLEAELPGPVDDGDPAREALVADSVGAALLMVLDTLTPGERLAFVLHDVFGVPLDEVATVVGRSPATARQLASRARRRLRDPVAQTGDLARQRVVVEAFLAASHAGDFTALLKVLDPDVVLRADSVTVQAAADRHDQGAPALTSEDRGAAAIARTFTGQAQAAQPALIDGRIGAVWAPHGRPLAVFDLTIVNNKIVLIELLSDPAIVTGLAITLL